MKKSTEIKSFEEILREKEETKPVTLLTQSLYENTITLKDFTNVFEGINYIVRDIREIHTLENRKNDAITYVLTFKYGGNKFKVDIFSELLKDCFGDLKKDFECELLFRIVDRLKYQGYCY